MAAEPPSNGETPDSANGDRKPRRNWFAIRMLIYISVVAILVALLLPAFQGTRSGIRNTCSNRLKFIGLALHNYHDVWGCFPPAYITDENGTPMHSWRVMLLPHLNGLDLYERYHFDEPWNGPNNSQLADAVPELWGHPLFRCPDDCDAAKTMTSYVAVIGPRTAFPGSEPVNIAQITDGTSDTIAIVEVANSGMHWMEPRDLHVLQMSPRINSPTGQGISSVHDGGAQVLFADGAVMFLREDLDAATVRAMLTIDGGEEIPAWDD